MKEKTRTEYDLVNGQPPLLHEEPNAFRFRFDIQPSYRTPEPMSGEEETQEPIQTGWSCCELSFLQPLPQNRHDAKALIKKTAIACVLDYSQEFGIINDFIDVDHTQEAVDRYNSYKELKSYIDQIIEDALNTKYEN